MEDNTKVNSGVKKNNAKFKPILKTVQDVTIRFAGDSGDGMQLTGSQFTDTIAATGHDIGILPDFPADIRAPAGSLYGVSGYTIRFSNHDIHTSGDSVDVLVAMNPAALKVNLKDLKKNGIIIANLDTFDRKNLDLAQYEKNPLEDGSLEGYNVYEIPITRSTLESLKDMNLPQKTAQKCKNFFALGLLYWLYNKSYDFTLTWLREKFKNQPELIEANSRVLKAGYYHGEITEIFTTRFEVEPAKLKKGTYRNLNGNEAIALGLTTAAARAGLQLFVGSYPITPASEIMQTLAKYKHFGVKMFQAEDEIAGICTAIGASFAGCLAGTTTSGPGMALKNEAIGLAVMAELPLVVVNVQRGGPSTGLPTKTEQADLFQAMFGRNGESPVPVLAVSSPTDCFYLAIEAARIAIKYMTPVILLSDGFIAQGSEPFRVPKISELPEIKVIFQTRRDGFFPYSRSENLARPWVKPGTKGLEHRIGGLEKQNVSGNVSYEPENHHYMVKLREKKIKKIETDIPELKVEGVKDSELLVLGWGSTGGAVADAVENHILKGKKVAYAILKYLNPMPKNTERILKSYPKILVPEVNLGQLAKLIRCEFLIDVIQFNKVKGLPFKPSEIEAKIEEILKV
ncbi:MAG: 2-oxoacid:acceptor oxidoreductase subunit alpha [Ignavibacteria bacterium]|nr:2-oxoacid:acceptor oxidoreductase subunit alpha [Ignavibacteria bacterium]